MVSEGSEVLPYRKALEFLVTDSKILDKLIALGSYAGEEIVWPTIMEVA